MDPILYAFSRVDTLVIRVGPTIVVSPTYALRIELYTRTFEGTCDVVLPRVINGAELFAAILRATVTLSSDFSLSDLDHSSLESKIVRCLTQAYPAFLVKEVSVVIFDEGPLSGPSGLSVRCE